MEGRWTIWKAGLKCKAIAGPNCDGVPVVPCDDAAIERAERAVMALPEWDVGDPRQVAEAVLRAAGETP